MTEESHNTDSCDLHSPEFTEPLYVGRPNIGSRERFLERINEMLDRRWFSNDGPLVRQFEEAIADYSGVKHCIALCNATVGLELAIRALNLTGEVILPSYTFIATAHALTWLGIRPVYSDIDPRTHNIDPVEVEKLITPLTSGVIGVHVWGRPCDTYALENIGSRYGLKVMYDAAHAFGCAAGGKMIGNFGECEVYSFHATKFLNSFEGGALVTNNDELAQKVRLMRNFGFNGFDNVVSLGINGKMSEPCAAMGLTSLESVDELIALNQRNHDLYSDKIADIPGIRLLERGDGERHNYQYVVIEIDKDEFGSTRDELVEKLHAHNVIARKYFWPGCHRMKAYADNDFCSSGSLKSTEFVADRVIVLPTGQAVDEKAIEKICSVISR